MNEEYIKKSDLLKLIENDVIELKAFQSLYTDQSAKAFEILAEKITKMPAEEVAPIKNCKQCKHAFNNPVYFDCSPCKRCSNYYEDKFEPKEYNDKFEECP